MIKVLFVIWSTLISFLFYNWSESKVQTVESTSILLDSLGNTVDILYNKEGVPTYYFSNVYTPVCNSSDCLPIKIELRWDLDGIFHSYEMPDKEILTKTDHIPFTAADYSHLNRILNDSLSVLQEHTVYSLEHSYEGKKEVDGITGATSMMTAGTYVPGALYTSVRLWHLVHKVKPKLKKYTSEKLLAQHDPKVLVSRKDVSASITALQSLVKDSEYPEGLLSEWIPSFDERMTKKVLIYLKTAKHDNSLIAPGFLSHYKSPDQSLKQLIDELWTSSKLDSPFLIQLVSQLENSPSYTDITIELLADKDVWSEELYHTIIAYCEKERNMNRRNRMKEILLKREGRYPKSVKKLLKSLGW